MPETPQRRSIEHMTTWSDAAVQYDGYGRSRPPEEVAALRRQWEALRVQKVRKQRQEQQPAQPLRNSDDIVQQILTDFRRAGEANDPWWLIPVGIVFFLLFVPLMMAGFLGFAFF